MMTANMEAITRVLNEAGVRWPVASAIGGGVDPRNRGRRAREQALTLFSRTDPW